MITSNKKTISLFLRRSKTYNILIDGFSKTLFWFITLRNNINIDFIISILGKVESTISTRIAVDALTLRKNMSSMTTLLQKIGLDYVLRIVYRIMSSISNSLHLDYTLRSIGQITSKISSKMHLSLSILVANFNSLYEYDGDTLSTMDGETLNVLDYSIV